MTPAESLAIRVPPALASWIEDLPDPAPLRRQFLPSDAEADPELPAWARALSLRAFGTPLPWRRDAIGDVARLAAPRLTHRYGNRALLHVTLECAVHCRFCFRKDHLGDETPELYAGELDAALAYVAAREGIEEVILTGGDPLSLPDRRLGEILRALAAIPHVRVVRLHTRAPTALPARVTAGLCTTLSDLPRADQALVVMLHANHADELSPDARAAIGRLRRAGVVLASQSVLLRGINDSAPALARLFTELYALGVLPTHLHHPDWTPGTFGFRVTLARGRALMRELRGRLSGPALPQYVLEIPGGRGKISAQDGEALRKVEDLPEPAAREAGLEGGLYEARGALGAALYLDLAPGRP